MKLRTLLFWSHLCAGAVAGAVIFLMSVTGVLLTYERQLVAWSDSHLRSTAPAVGGRRMAIDQLLQAFFKEHPDVSLTAITIGSAVDAPVVLTGSRRTLYVDAYTGRFLGEGSQGVRRVMSEIRAWHRWLAVEGEGRAAARALTGWSNLIFAFMVLSGIYLWFPRQWTWQRVKPVIFFRGGLRGKARDFNWHNVIGSWSMVPLFIVVVSAIPMSFPWANALVYRAVGEDVPAGRGGGRGDGGGKEYDLSRVGFGDLLTRAAGRVPGWTTITARLPTAPNAPVAFTIDRGDGGQPHLRSTLTTNRQGEIVTYEDFSDLTLGRRIRNVMRFAHTGEVLGIPGQTVAGLVSAGSSVLVWTGLALAWRRLRASVARRRADREEPAAQSSAA